MRAYRTATFVLVLFASGRAIGADCDANLAEDSEEIDRGFAPDCNGNGVPDHCEVEPVPYRLVRSLPVRDNATGLYVADLNGDGFTDIAIGTVSGVSVRLRVGQQPDVTFEESTYPIVERGEDWAGGDLDGDGDDDLVASSGSELQLLFNDGSGAFTERILIPLVRGLEEIAIGDINADGRSDIAVANRVSSAVLVLENLGDRSFGEPLSIAVRGPPTSLVVTDTDQDGDGDIVCNSGTSTSLLLIVHEQAMKFATPEPLDTGGGSPIGVTAADFNGDGQVDLATVTRSSAVVLLNQGANVFSLGGSHRMEGTSSAFGVGDFDSDGDPDLVGGYQRPRGVFAFHNTDAGALGAQTELALALNLSPSSIALQDLDMDGDDDLLMILQAAVSVFWNDGNQDAGVEAPLETAVTFVAGGPPHAADLGDIDGDGDIDVVMGHNNAGTICISRNHGDGTFGDPEISFPEITSWTLTVADFDGDGDADVVTSNRGQLVLLRNPGDGVFERATSVRSGGSPAYLTHADVDGDGDPDLLNATGGNTVHVHLNAGDGTFPDRVTERAGSGTRGVSPFDMDNDGDLDLAVANHSSSEVTFLKGDGNGTFGDPLTLPVLGQPNFVVAADLDGDGNADAVTANQSNGNVSVFWNLGGGAFAAGINLDVERELYSMWTGDLTGDGLSELVTVTEAGRAVSVLINGGARTFSTPVRYEVGSGPRHVRVADLDGDGDQDVVSVNRGGSSFSILRNEPKEQEGVDFVSTICTPLDFFEVSRASRPSPLERSTRFVLPARDNAELLAPVFQNLSRFSRTEQFLAELLPERFPTPPQGEKYQEVVGRRATREYFTGRITRMPESNGFSYTFTIAADTDFDLGEALTLAEVQAVYEQLRAVFTLTPLAYEPDSAAARSEAESWVDPPFPIFFTEDVSEPEPLTPTFQLEVGPGAIACGVFPTNAPGRSQQTEYETKSTLRFAEGTFALPTKATSFSVDLVDELVFGPDRLVAQPDGPGTFRVLQLAAGEDTVHRFIYEQLFTLPTGELFTVQMFGLDFRSRGGIPTEPARSLDEEFLTFGGAVEGLLNGDPTVDYSSCTYPLLPSFVVETTLSDGSRLRLEEQFLEVQSELDTGPAALVGAEITLGGETQSTDDYWRLVYAARRHNQDVRYRVVLDPAVELTAFGAAVEAVEILAPQPGERENAIVNYLDADFALLGSAEVANFDKRSSDQAPEKFRRGDVDGNGRVNLTDAVVLLDFLFRATEAPACLRGGDTNDDGHLNLVDAVRAVRFVLGQGEALPPPLGCGVDPTPDALPCAAGCE